MSLQGTQISWHTRCKSRHVASIASIASSLEVENIELFGQHHMTLCRIRQSVSRFSRRQWHSDSINFAGNLTNRHRIRHGGQNNCWCVWIPQNSYNTTSYITGLSYEHTHGIVKFSSVSGTSTTDTVQKRWLNWLGLMVENGKHPYPLTLLANANCGWHRAVRHNWTGSGWFYEKDKRFIFQPVYNLHNWCSAEMMIHRP